MTNFSLGYSSSWRLMEVDGRTWADSSEVEGLMSVSVSRDTTGRLIESASATIDIEKWPEGKQEFWGRIEMLATQDGGSERYPIATLLFSPSKSSARRGRSSVELTGRSVLAPAEDRVMLVGSYAPSGSDGAKWAASILSECIVAPIVVEDSFTLSDNIVFAQGTTMLEAAWMVLDSADWRIGIADDGTVMIGPKPSSPAIVLDAKAMNEIGCEVSIESKSEVPNRYIAVDGDAVGIAVDDDPDRPTSVVNIGRYVDVFDSSPTRVNGETLAAYAERRLKEECSVQDTLSYDREWRPGVGCFDMVRWAASELGIECDSRVVSQNIELGSGALVNERAEVIA